MHIFEIRIQRKYKDSWPVVVEYTKPGRFVPTRHQGILKLNNDSSLDELKALLDLPRDYGTMLGKSLFYNNVRDAFVGALRTLEDSRDNQDCLQVLLDIEADDLKELRWEKLCAPVDGDWDFLALKQKTPFSLYIPAITERLFPSIGRRDLQALVVVASPEELEKYEGLARFDVQATVSSVKEALGEIPCDVLAKVDGATGLPTLDELMRCLTNNDKYYTLLHLVCHGKLLKNGETTLYLADADNRVAPVDGNVLLERLRRLGRAPHFAFLSTCESASPEAEAEAEVGGLAQRLVRELGMPAVVAMTEKVSIWTAQVLAPTFYEKLKGHGNVALALVQATAGLQGRYDINVPALFSRLGGHPLFSDMPNRPLTEKEINYGLERLEQLLTERSPVLCEEFKNQKAALQRTLGAETDVAIRERKKALAEVDKLSAEVLELSFKALALGTEPPACDARCPFRGLYRFGLEDREFFCGRTQLVEQLQQKLTEHNFLPVLGASGSGKSSLILAGLIPALQAQEPQLQMAYMTPTADPLAELEANLLKGQNPPCVLVVDQFEELFTLCIDKDKRQGFINELLKLVDQKQRLIITMRADFWGECAPYSELRDLMKARQELIAPMNSVELREAIDEQAKKVGLRFEVDLANKILDDVDGEPGAMPLLQHALLELWKRRHGRWLLSQEYRAIGGVQKAIANTADRIYNSLSEKDKEQVKDIFIRLTRLDENTISGEKLRNTRRRVKLKDLKQKDSNFEVTKRLVNRLADNRLVVISSGQVEVVHEALISYWPNLQNWLENDWENFRLRQTINQWALEWQNNSYDESYLMLRGRQMENAKILFQQPSIHLTESERAYIEACVVVRERERINAGEQRLKNLSEMGWGIIFADNEDPSVIEALRELLEHRRKQATQHYSDYYREFTGSSGYRSGDTKRSFLNRYGVGSGYINPSKVPYYLLIVGDPNTIPYPFQYQLDMQYAVGRIHFDTPQEYAQYARSVVEAETGKLSLPRRVTFFGVKNPGDTATKISAEHLVKPLADRLREEQPDWLVQTVLEEEATKARLGELIGGSETPALLFTAGHGVGFPSEDPRQLHHQGALLCQDWPGIEWRGGPISEDFYFSADDVSNNASLHGLISFFLNSYSAGTPQIDDCTSERGHQKPSVIAPYSFVAHLPKRLLSFPQGGVLAVIGRVANAWGYSIYDIDSQIDNLPVFVNALKRLMHGFPVGAAMEPFNLRYAELTSELSETTEQLQLGNLVDPFEVSSLDIATKDARNYIVLGDPAVRLMVSETAETAEVKQL